VNLDPGQPFPDLDLPDHTGRARRLTEVAAGDPVALLFSRGWWCPKEQRHLREVTALQDEFEVAYTRIVVVSIDAPEVQSAFRAGLGARYVFLSDGDRRWLEQLDLLEETDTKHRPYRPTAFTLHPDLTIHAAYDGNWYWGRPTVEDLRQDMRTISRAVRDDFQR